MKIVHPFEHIPDRKISESLKHYILDNGYTVSILHTQIGTWEAWAWPTAIKNKPLTDKPVIYIDENEAIDYRNSISKKNKRRS